MKTYQQTLSNSNDQDLKVTVKAWRDGDGWTVQAGSISPSWFDRRKWTRKDAMQLSADIATCLRTG